ncbi:formylglycine-generating enzyme family protein [Dethiosulfatarculus sandiegensis]|uniref:Sulphatase-modifying factor protein n=1 Tax=Dethiosulfatarculus sandiegensis TaxID=1429043 RepID=A0A0D2J6P5_9BACT|nr:formylglycine-generating enzyme family protein [Dethiosulfatarculus sandiegensis]KIX11351.1 Sulphatase-modifying factor protein [Dethiosulfatarculus sandiegensis]
MKGKRLSWNLLAVAALALGLCLGFGESLRAESSLPAKYKNSLGMEFALIPAGKFTMGSPADASWARPNETPHQVTFSQPFYMQTTEVTLGQWRALMGKRFLIRRKGGPDIPVSKVSWHDAMRFVAKLNQLGEGVYNLPTEAQWEYACRAGSDTAYFWGNSLTCSQAMYGNNPIKNACCLAYIRKKGLPVSGPAPVKSYPPNAWGLYDMHGNLWEWCRDWFGPYPEKAVTDPTGPADGVNRVRRGGSWYRGVARLRSTNRNFANPDSMYSTLGFRVIRETP